MSSLVTKAFIFNRLDQSLVASLKQILHFINEHTQHHESAGIIQFRTKAIVTELLNNAIKHSSETETIIDVTIDDQKISIKKKDSGPRFNPNGLLTSPSHGETITLSSDDLNCMYAIVQHDDSIIFVCEENTGDTVDLNHINEHFGLLIITKSADEFYYRYNEETGTSIFEVNIMLHQ